MLTSYFPDEGMLNQPQFVSLSWGGAFDVIYVEFKVFQEYFQVFLDSWTRIFRSIFANESLTLQWRSSLSLSVRLGRLLLSVTCG